VKRSLLLWREKQRSAKKGGFIVGVDISKVNTEIPRKVYLDGQSAIALGFGLLMLLFGIAMFIWMSNGAITGLHTRQVLVRDGRTVIGDIKKVSRERIGEFVRYAFSVDEVPYSGQAEMEMSNYELPGDQNRILIRYLPNDPRVNQPVNWQWVSIWDAFPLLLLLSITALGAKVILTALRLRALMRIGIVALGKVTGCAPNKNLFKVYYEYAAEDGTTVEGSCDLKDEYEVGVSIPVIYLRSNPQRNYRFPVGGFRIAE
jgi:hypothetical protein